MSERTKIIDHVVEIAVNNMRERHSGREVIEGLAVDEAIDNALETEIEYGHHNNGNTWYRTTGYRYGLTARGIKQALRNRNYI